jgi:dephospho-CoA kinase
MPLKVGLTGGIGSGKSTVARIFELLNIPVYYADDRAKALYIENTGVKEKVTHLLGESAYTPTGELNRAFVAEKVFSDSSLLKQLEAIIHPAVWEDGEKWDAQHANAPYTIKEAALLYESGGYKKVDKMIVVRAPEQIRIQRVIRRDEVAPEQVRARIRQQMPEEEKVQRADFVIDNSGSRFLIPQILKIHQQLLSIIQSHQ